MKFGSKNGIASREAFGREKETSAHFMITEVNKIIFSLFLFVLINKYS
jgi:hypothetical protein